MADHGSDHQFRIAKFRLKFKKIGKTTRSFRHDLNQILCDYTVEVMNRFKGLDLVDRVPEELWCNIVQHVISKSIPEKMKSKEAKCLSEEASQIAKKRREAEGKEGREIYTQLNAEFQRIARRDKKVLSEQCKEIEQSNRMIKTRHSKKIGDNEGIFHKTKKQ